MRELLLAAFVAAAPLAWCKTAGGQILAEAPHNLAGWGSGGPATGVVLILSVGDSESASENPGLFDQVVLTPADVGRVVSIGSGLDDPDFADVSAALTNGVSDFAQLTAWIQPGGGGLGHGFVESNLFAPPLESADLAGSTVEGIALRIDALTLNEPSDGWVDLRFTLLVIGSPEGSGSSLELAQCRDELEEARYDEFRCWHLNVEFETAVAGLEERLVACEVDLGWTQVEASRLEAELVLAQSAAHEAQAERALAQAQLAHAQAALAAALADADADGVRDAGDSCLGTGSAAAVDGLGCSLAQFCSAIDATTGSGRATCNHVDWRNDEPLTDSPNDCKAAAGLCAAR